MLEIYNEQARDLLNKKKTPRGGLRIKESPGRGFYGKISPTHLVCSVMRIYVLSWNVQTNCFNMATTLLVSKQLTINSD